MRIENGGKQMRVGVLVKIFMDTDIDKKFAEIRQMGMESCQLYVGTERFFIVMRRQRM